MPLRRFPLAHSASLSTAIAGLIACSSQGVSPRRLTPAATSVELELAAAALADSSSGPFFQRDRLETGVAVLRWIHTHYPETRNVEAGADLSLQFRMPDSLFKRLFDTTVAATSGDRWLQPPRTGLPDFDRITDAVGGAKGIHVQGLPQVFAVVTVYYREPVNVPGVARAYASLRPAIDISPMQGIRIGGGDRIHIEAGDSLWTVQIMMGWGDCMAGCINWHSWMFQYRPRTGKIEAVSDSGPPVPAQRSRD